ncbi:hypothetical protein NS365_05575 [Aureimonas ureilytica]|uniref:DNA primase/polymerase bifunctional N-terminal domain-containing protein n=1 Tax=Aureimonas ureilytica TaxID=401562 RepID=A0A175RV98_9HYPH|nr:bifunctional DNA primase/polymerase [Aureimonas ureilytica]KTR06904.1 hypothetical protein NS365_05575 [Aureimonas ureilytica]
MTPQYRPRGSIHDAFRTVAPVATVHGWAMIPSRADRVPMKAWKAYVRTGVGPNLDQIESWAREFSDMSRHVEATAMLLGEPSGNTFAIDCDTDSVEGREVIRSAMADHLPTTPFTRMSGHNTRFASIFRFAHPDDLITKDFTLAHEAADCFSILGNGRLLMAYGEHAASGKPYTWEDARYEPFTTSTWSVPVVTVEQVDAFLAAVHEKIGIRDFDRKMGRNQEPVRFEMRDDIRVPHISTAGYVLDSRGRVTDGRERFMFRIATLIVRANPHAASTEDGRAGLREMTYRVFCEKAVTHAPSISGRQVARFSTDESIRYQIADKVGRISEALGSAAVPVIRNAGAYSKASGGQTRTADVHLMPSPAARKPRVTDSYAAPFPILSLGTWLAPDGVPTHRTPGVSITVPPITHEDYSRRGGQRERLIEAREIPGDVRPTSARVTAETKNAIETLLLDAFGYREEDGPAPVSCLRGLPATGKTTRIVETLAGLRSDVGAPLRAVMLAPQHRNLNEIAEDARRAGLVVRQIRGRSSVCKNPVVERLEAKGVSPGRVCKAVVASAAGQRTEQCPHFVECPAFSQYEDLETCDLILAPHALLSMPVDKRLIEAAQIVIVDESFHSVVLDSATMPLETLIRQRGIPPVSAAERARGHFGEIHRANRDDAVAIAYRRLKAGDDIAPAFADHPHGEELLVGAIATVARGDSRAARVNPKSTIKSLDHILSADDAYGREEARFWRIVDERRRMIVAARDVPSIVVPSHEARIRLSGDTVHLSWRNDLNFRSVPWILLDGSADLHINEKILGTPIKTIHVTAPLRQHLTLVRHNGMSGTALRKAVDEMERTGRSPLLEEAAGLVTRIAQQHLGEILVVVRGVAEDALRGMMQWPDRIRFGHHGALKGLNAYESSEAIVIIGNLLPSPDALDDLAAALSYDDADPEPALVGRDGTIQWVRSEHFWPMRDGSDAQAEGPGTKGVWHTRMLAQLRDEDLIQNAARGRQVHRQEPMALYLVGDHVPAGTVVDLVVTPKTVLEATPSPKARAVQKPKLRVVA